MITEKEYLEAMRQFAEVKKTLIESILDLPDNPEITRLDDRCFVMQSSKLLNNWSAEFYDFKHQYRQVAEELRKATPENLLNRLREILKEKKIRISGTYHSYGYTYHLNPAVVAHIVKAVGLEEELCGA